MFLVEFVRDQVGAKKKEENGAKRKGREGEGFGESRREIIDSFSLPHIKGKVEVVGEEERCKTHLAALSTSSDKLGWEEVWSRLPVDMK